MIPQPEGDGVSLRVIAAGVLTPATSRSVVNNRATLFGYSITETTGAAAATVRLCDAPDGNGLSLALITLTAGQSVRENLPAFGLNLDAGLFVSVIAGSVDVSVYVTTP
jgi:hypothetical protein